MRKILLLIFSLSCFQAISQTCTGTFSLRLQSEVNTFGPCTSIIGSLFIGGANSDITNLSPLSSLSTISGSLTIESADVLTSLGAFSNLSSVGLNLNIFNNPSLGTIGTLSSLQSIGGFLNIELNQGLTNLNSFPNLTSVGTNLNVISNLSLTDCTGICPLINANGVNGIIVINNNGTGCTLSELQSICPGLPLPVELVKFNATLIGQETIKLEWSTLSQINNKGFGIEKSYNLIDWNEIGFISSEIFTNDIENYYFFDKNPFNGINYYRIRQIDIDDTFEYSKIISVETKSHNNSFIQLFPMPHVNNQFHIRNLLGYGDLIIFNLMGKVIQKLDIRNSEMRINTSHWQPGQYILKFQFDDGSVTYKKCLKFNN